MHGTIRTTCRGTKDDATTYHVAGKEESPKPGLHRSHSLEGLQNRHERLPGSHVGRDVERRLGAGSQAGWI